MCTSLAAVMKQRHVGQTVTVVHMATALQDLRQKQRETETAQRHHFVCLFSESLVNPVKKIWSEYLFLIFVLLHNIRFSNLSSSSLHHIISQNDYQPNSN